MPIACTLCFSREHFKIEDTEQCAVKLLERARRFGSQLNHNRPKSRLSLTTTSLAPLPNDVSIEERLS